MPSVVGARSKMPYSPDLSRSKKAIPLPRYCDTADNLNALAQRVNTQSISFQSVLVAAVQIMDKVYSCEQRISDAAISLAQKRKMAEMVTRTKLLRFSLFDLLNDQGSRILELQANSPDGIEKNVSWWYHITEGIETLEVGIDWIGSLISGQSQDSPVRELSNLIAELLREHYEELLKEAEHWLTA